LYSTRQIDSAASIGFDLTKPLRAAHAIHSWRFFRKDAVRDELIAGNHPDDASLGKDPQTFDRHGVLQ
jgi:hypothetical protein